MGIINSFLMQNRLNAMRGTQKPIVAPVQAPLMQKPMQVAPAPMPAPSQMPVPAKPIVASTQTPLMQQPVQATPPSLPASPARPVPPQPDHYKAFWRGAGSPRSEDDWRHYSAVVHFAPGTDIQKAQTDFLAGYKKGGRVKVAQDAKKKYTSGGKINLNECGVSTAPKGKKNSNW
jgi:hypothetical protein